MEDGDFEVDINFLKELAIFAGEQMLNAAPKIKNFKSKKTEADLVTETDVAIENSLKERILNRFPKHSFLCEESANNKSLTEEPTWIIDPIDGTTNFIHGFPLFCVSIGFSRNKKIILGCIFIPQLNELYYAVKGRGSFLNGIKIHTSECSDLSKALVSTAFNISQIHQDSDSITSELSSDQSHIKERNLKNFNSILTKIRDLRHLGSSAIELAFIACGRLDALYQFGPYEWDLAAGVLLIEEAGGTVCDIDGTPLKDIGLRRVLAASTNKLANSLSGLLTS